MRWFVAAPLLLALSLPVPAETSLPLDAMMPLLADLADRGSYGGHYAERGAFIVSDDNGQVQCVLWPFSGEFHRTSSRMAMPAGTIAIAHTHPRCCRSLSARDIREAERLRIPVIAVSMGTMEVTEGAGGAKTSRRGLRWSQFLESGRRCTAAPPSPGAEQIELGAN